MIFHGTATEDGGKIEAQEKHLYQEGVTVHFNTIAYNDETLMINWLDNKLIPILQPSENSEILLVYDYASFYKTSQIKKKLKKKDYILSAVIPGGCTGILQPLDTTVNKPFKELLRVETETYMDEREDREGENYKWTTSDKRIIVIFIVVAAWERFCTTKQELVWKAFKNVGLSISLDGIEDHLLAIKGYEHGKPEIGDWSRVEEPEIESYIEVNGPGEDDTIEYIHDSEESISSDYSGLSKLQLFGLCYERGITRIISKNKADIRKALIEYDKEHQ